jgi:hypothetical protein
MSIMKILVVNPNITASMTEKIGVCAQNAASPGTEIIARNPQSPYLRRTCGLDRRPARLNQLSSDNTPGRHCGF